MTWPRMWKCNVYTFNHVLSHRPPSPPLRIRNYVCLSSPLFASLFSSSSPSTSTLNQDASILIHLRGTVLKRLTRVLLLRFRGGGGRERGTTVLLRGVESIKMDARRFLAMAMSVDARELASATYPPLPPSDEHANSEPVTRAFSHPE